MACDDRLTELAAEIGLRLTDEECRQLRAELLAENGGAK